MHRNRWPGQVQKIRQPGRQKILVIAGMAQQEQADFFNQSGVRQQIERQISLHARPGINPDPAIEVFWHMARILERFPSGFQKMPVLGIKDRGFTRRKPKKPRVKTVHIRQDIGFTHVMGVGQHLTADASGKQFSLAQLLCRTTPRLQHIPIVGHIARGRKTPGTAYNGNAVVRGVAV